MCPTDTTPDPRDMLHVPDEPEFRQPRPDAAAQADRLPPGATDMSQRPPLPDRPVLTAVDIEDEDADPVGSTEPELGERLQSDSQLQRG